MSDHLAAWRCYFSFWCIVLISFLLRVWNIHYGLPFFQHPDEWIYVRLATRLMLLSEPNPEYFQNPPFLIYMLGGIWGLFSLVWNFLALLLPLKDFNQFFFSDFELSTLSARYMVASMGVGTVVLVYALGRDLWNKKVGLLAAIFLGTCFLHVKDSHYAVSDVPATFLMMGAFYILSVARQGNHQSARAFLLAGFLSGLAAATKYNMGCILFVFLILSFFVKPRFSFQQVGLFLLSSFISFGLGCPWILLDAQHFFKEFVFQLMYAKEPWWLGGSSESSFYQTLKTLLWGYGFYPLILSGIGMILLWVRDRRSFLILFSFVLVYSFFLFGSRLFFVRFVIPVLPFLSLLTAYGVWALFELLRFKGKGLLEGLVVLIVISQSVFLTIQHNLLIGGTDSRISSRHWMIRNVPSRSRILAPKIFGPSLVRLGDDLIKGKAWDVQLLKDRFSESVEKIRSEGYDYVITSSFMRGRYKASPDKFPKECSFYQGLDQKTQLVYSSHNCDPDIPVVLDEIYTPFWSVLRLDNPGPCIKIYELES